jgi:hypothetical protein
MTKVQKAFHYFMDLLNDVYETGWKAPEALDDAAIEFSLDEHEIKQLRWIHEAFNVYGLDFALPAEVGGFDYSQAAQRA